jgi:hypothetical protein
MLEHIFALGALGGGLWLVGCSSPSAGAGGSSSADASCSPTCTFSCDVKNATYGCYEYDNIPSIELSMAGMMCTGQGGTVGTGCSSTNRLGTCAATGAGVTTKKAFYSDGSLTASQAQNACTSHGGVWTAG